MRRGLVLAALALKQLARAMAHDIVIGRTAPRAAKPDRPARRLQRVGALRLGTEAAQELGDRHAGLELDWVEGHGARSIVRQRQLMGSQAHGVSLLRQVSNQEYI
jgi:hypothetical protein